MLNHHGCTMQDFQHTLAGEAGCFVQQMFLRNIIAKLSQENPGQDVQSVAYKQVTRGQARLAEDESSMVLAHACSGIDITSPGYLEGIETAVQACVHNFGK